MKPPFNKLSPAEAERLHLLSEECAEVIKAVNKILRHGYDSYNPLIANSKSNRADLEQELGDVLIAMDLLYDSKGISRQMVAFYRQLNAEQKLQYIHYHQESGELK